VITSRWQALSRRLQRHHHLQRPRRQHHADRAGAHLRRRRRAGHIDPVANARGPAGGGEGVVGAVVAGGTRRADGARGPRPVPLLHPSPEERRRRGAAPARQGGVNRARALGRFAVTAVVLTGVWLGGQWLIGRLADQVTTTRRDDRVRVAKTAAAALDQAWFRPAQDEIAAVAGALSAWDGSPEAAAPALALPAK